MGGFFALCLGVVHDDLVVRTSRIIAGTWNVLFTIQTSWVGTLVGLNLGWVVLLVTIINDLNLNLNLNPSVQTKNN